jgi:hypothetical protein
MNLQKKSRYMHNLKDLFIFTKTKWIRLNKIKNLMINCETCLFVKTLQESKFTIIFQLHFLFKFIIVGDVENYIDGVVTMLRVVWSKMTILVWRACDCCSKRQKCLQHCSAKNLQLLHHEVEVWCAWVQELPKAMNMCRE